MVAPGDLPGKFLWDIVLAWLCGRSKTHGPGEQVKIDPFKEASLSADKKKAILENVQLCRDAIVFFTACGSASGYGGHTGGAFDTVPEVCLPRSFFKACPDKFVPIMFDEAGHRVATQYLLAAIDGDITFAHLKNYRVGHANLPGHPELRCTPGVKFSSGRLGQMWPMVNGVAMANKDKIAWCLGSDGSQMEGNDSEAARLAVAQGLKVRAPHALDRLCQRGEADRRAALGNALGCECDADARGGRGCWW